MLCEDISWESGVLCWPNGYQREVHFELARKESEGRWSRRAWLVFDKDQIPSSKPQFVPDAGSPKLVCDVWNEPCGQDGKVALKLYVA